jgi:N-formylglutamate deformylase
MDNKGHYSINQIKEKLAKNNFPFSGITELGSAEFYFQKPAFYAGVALHSGSRVRPEVLKVMEATKADRFREEDPYTDLFIQDFPIQIKGCDSRFEYDLNRESHRAIYDTVKKTWGIKVWKKELPEREREITLAKHHEFYDLMTVVTDYLLQQNNYAVIFDMHSYCYQRNGSSIWFEDPKPEINVGTKAANRTVFGPAIELLVDKLNNTRIENRIIRVRENEVFEGGYLAKQFSAKHYDRLLVFALEYKKIFMNELSGELFKPILDKLVDDFSIVVKDLIKSDLFVQKTGQ